MFKSIIRRWREWRNPADATTQLVTGDVLTSVGHSVGVGDAIGFFTSTGVSKGTGAVVTAVTGSTITFRTMRWYERLWVKVKHIWNWREHRAFNKLYNEAAKRQKQRDIERDILNAEVIGE